MLAGQYGWRLEVTFHDSKQHLGFGQAQNQTPRAVARTAPFAGVVYSLVLLWAAAHLQQGGTLSWIVRPWYRSKTAVAFPDLLQRIVKYVAPVVGAGAKLMHEYCLTGDRQGAPGTVD